MLIGAIKILFIVAAILLSILIIIHKQYTSKVKDNVKISNFVAVIGFSLVAYIICAIIIGIFYGGLIYRILMFLFAICPFIIGKMATYQKVKLYSSIQIIVMLASCAVVCLK